MLEPAPSTIRSPGSGVKGEVALLIDSYRPIQQKQLRTLIGRYGTGPHLHKAAERLRSGELIAPRDLDALPGQAERDATGRAKQDERRLAYEKWRHGAARQRARKAGPLGRFTRRPEEFSEQLDRKWLGVCRPCREIVYPQVEVSGYVEHEPACHYCHTTEKVGAYREDALIGQEGDAYL